MKAHYRIALGMLGLGLIACGSAPPPAPRQVAQPQTTSAPSAPQPKPKADPNAVPPKASYVPPRPFPAVASDTLENGLQVQVIERHALPVVTVEMVINSGLASESDRAGAARITAEWLEAGGAGRWNSQQLRQAIDSLGATLDINVTRDALRFSMTVTTDHMEAALELLAAIIQKPRFDRIEFEKLRQRELERVESLSRTNGSWMAQMWLQKRLFRLPVGVHPYASYDLMPGELQRLTTTTCRDWYREFVSPRNAYLLLVGDVTSSAAQARAARLFSGWSGPEVKAFHPSSPEGIDKFEIFVVDKPNSTQSDIFLATLGPNRHDATFTQAAMAQQIVGGGVSGRLFLDVREKRSLAYSTGAGIQDLAAAPSVLYLSAGTQTAKTAEAVGALIEHFDNLGTDHFTSDELETAQHFLVDSMPTRWEQVQSLAAQLAQLRIQSLPNDYYDTFRDSIVSVSSDSVANWAHGAFRREHAVLVLSGDSKVVAPTLTKYAPVNVVSPAQGFRLTNQLPRTAVQ